MGVWAQGLAILLVVMMAQSRSEQQTVMPAMMATSISKQNYESINCNLINTTSCHAMTIEISLSIILVTPADLPPKPATATVATAAATRLVHVGRSVRTQRGAQGLKHQLSPAGPTEQQTHGSKDLPKMEPSCRHWIQAIEQLVLRIVAIAWIKKLMKNCAMLRTLAKTTSSSTLLPQNKDPKKKIKSKSRDGSRKLH